jgi:hypothetical protein
MSTRVGTYANVVERTALMLPELTSADSAAIWRLTAQRVYDIVDAS